ncbi:mechanosensitive ion channel family protein [Ilumatobacter sp.]|uniref:mechanosensitive ion channel family protein n=1 Tax=Ilumatobacter sp. TaxID=1967498 RepID=UPI003B517252
MIAVEFSQGIEDAWSNIAEFVPKLAVFLIILVVGWIIAKIVAKAADGILEKVGFDGMVEKGSVKKALDKSQLDASDMLAKVVKYFIYLLTLQAAFGVFGDNPISDLINDIVSYLPNIFVAIIIIVIAGAIAAAVKELIDVALANLSYGSALANAASIAILVIGVFAALDQLQIAEDIVNGLFYAILAIIVGTVIVAVGGSGVTALRPYWDRALNRADEATSQISDASEGASDRIEAQARKRAAQTKQATGTSGRGGATPTT